MRLTAMQIRSFFTLAKPLKVPKPHFFTKFASGTDVVKKTNYVFFTKNAPGKDINKRLTVSFQKIRTPELYFEPQKIFCKI